MKPLRWSNLRYMADCPAAYRHYLEYPMEATPAMRFGSLVHALVLGVANHEYVVYEGQRRGNAWAEFKEAHSGVEIVTEDEMHRAANCAQAVLFDPICGPLISNGLKEHRITWTMQGRECAGTPDVNGGILVDLKVTPMANPNKMPWHCKKMLWHAQLQWYQNAIMETGGTVEAVYLIAVTPKPPYLCVPYELTVDTLDLGYRTWRSLFERLLVCEASNSFPGYAQEVVPLELVEDDFSLTIEGEEFEL